MLGDPLPTHALCTPVEDAVVEFTVLVDEDSAPPLTTGREFLEDILVLLTSEETQ